MNYNFDEVIDRRGTNCVKYDFCYPAFGTNDLLPMWIADMDFRTPDFIFEAVSKRSAHPLLGYSRPPHDYFCVISNWIRKLHNWETREEWMGFIPGIVQGLSFAVQIFSEAGDEVIIQPPVYQPFIHCVEKNDRKLVYNPLKIVNGQFEMDFDDLEQKITPKTKLLILCSPHNPGGRVWSKTALAQLAEICAKNDIVVVSDEIHADMVLPNQPAHTPFAKVSETAKNISVTFMAPSKLFNMPGLISSYFIIPNVKLREKFFQFLEKNDLINGNIFAYEATKSAYLHGSEWRRQMLEYVQGNIDYVVDFLAQHLPKIKPMIPEASFLIFLDCTELKLSPDELNRLFVEKIKIGLNDGRMFGPGGDYFLRMNVGCPRSVIEEAMERFKKLNI